MVCITEKAIMKIMCPLKITMATQKKKKKKMFEESNKYDLR